MPRLKYRSEKGFGLLEALVALVLLSSVGFTLLAWVHQNLDTAQRLRVHYEEQEAGRFALEYLRTINPMEISEGEFRRKNLRFVWKASLSGPVISQIGYEAGIGKHEVALYSTRFSVFRDKDETPWFRRELTMIGHKKSGPRSVFFGAG